MKATRLVGFTLPAVLVTVLAVLPAGPAAAAAKVLVLKSGGLAVANGSPGSVGVTVQECGIFSNGTVATNSATKDVLKGTSASEAECPNAGESISGLITETQLKPTGAASFRGVIKLSLPGSCSYEFKNPKATFKAPGNMLIEGRATGKLAKGSAKSCAKTDPQTLIYNITSEPFGEPFTDEVT